MEHVRFWMVGQELALKMFTLCGWFFDSYTGIEAQQILAYAERFIEHTSDQVEWSFIEGLKEEFAELRPS
jgi:Mn-dependent DtxR family transcriptional regulator